MSCEQHCCGADIFFDKKSAHKRLKNYEKKGTRNATKKLVELLLIHDIKEKKLLDIGGGIGAIQWEFLKNGGNSTQDVDSSNAYINVAKAYADKNEFGNRSEFVFGNFVEKVDEVNNADFVTLDKVVCCYPDYKSLLGQALDKCTDTIVLSYPLGGPISKFVNFLSEFYLYFKDNPFRSFVHPPKEIEQFILSKGFRAVKKTIAFPWHVQAYSRIEKL